MSPGYQGIRMTASVIDGKAYAAGLRARIGEAVKTLPAQPTLAVVLIGEDPASMIYVKNKIRFTRETGMGSVEYRLPAHITQDRVTRVVRTLNADVSVDGILVQLPLPEHINEKQVIAEIAPDKDVDGLTEVSAGRLMLGKPGLRPCTPTGCVMLAREAVGALTGKSCVILGRSILVGKPAALLFLEQNCTVTIVHSRTRDIETVCRGTDILVAAAGCPELVQPGWIKPGACIIDVGINRVKRPDAPGRTHLVGDVDYRGVSEVAGSITPVPGGVGPMTIACLLSNTVLAACLRRGWPVPDKLNL